MSNDLNALAIYLESIKERTAAEEIRKAANKISELEKNSVTLLDRYVIAMLPVLIDKYGSPSSALAHAFDYAQEALNKRKMYLT